MNTVLFSTTLYCIVLWVYFIVLVGGVWHILLSIYSFVFVYFVFTLSFWYMIAPYLLTSPDVCPHTHRPDQFVRPKSLHSSVCDSSSQTFLTSHLPTWKLLAHDPLNIRLHLFRIKCHWRAASPRLGHFKSQLKTHLLFTAFPWNYLMYLCAHNSDVNCMFVDKLKESWFVSIL